MARKPRTTSNGDTLIETADYRHPGKRKNIPPAKMERQGTVPKAERAKYHYNPHLPPELRFDPTGGTDRLPTLIAAAQKRPLTEAEAKALAEALKSQQPWLEWAGKKEEHDQGTLSVNPVALHLHERISAKAIVRAAMRQDVEQSLFAAAEDDYAKAVQFYKHDVDWSNRLIMGDSLEVMSSLARREGLAGKVQMIYMDPPYGIKFGSNFQPEVGKRDVKDKDEDLTREPEMVRAYRDTWHLGIHSYLSYLRDRLLVARELLADTGSIFVHISDENLQRVSALLDEVFGGANQVSVIPFKKTSGAGSISGGTKTIASVADYLVWYAKDIDRVKYRQLYSSKTYGGDGASQYTWIEEANGLRRRISAADDGDALVAEGAKVFGSDNLTSSSGVDTTRYPVTFEGITQTPHPSVWKTGATGMPRLLQSERLIRSGRTLWYVRYLQDFPARPLSNLWDDTVSSFMADKVYVVQTNTKVIERCILMTTEPGDLVLGCV